MIPLGDTGIVDRGVLGDGVKCEWSRVRRPAYIVTAPLAGNMPSGFRCGVAGNVALPETPERGVFTEDAETTEEPAGGRWGCRAEGWRRSDGDRGRMVTGRESDARVLCGIRRSHGHA